MPQFARPPSACSLRTVLVACNIYISAGARRKTDGPLLLRLLQQAQQSKLRDGAVVAHAYVDTVYNRSSFHLIGRAEAVSMVTSDLALMAVQELRHVRDNDEYYQSAAASAAEHPLVGLVDHVSIMPLTGAAIPSERDIEIERQRQAAAWAARKVGSFMEENLNIRVLYYGMAHPENMSLAMVRREQTQFFQSGGLAKLAQPQTHPTAYTPEQEPRETATVGVPEHFVENYNVRLQCSRNMAQSLTRRIRERDGGLPGVEALTLPYSEGRWEVACNLLRPSSMGATATDIQASVDQWEKEQQQGPIVEIGYRVGTTVNQCVEAWECCMASDSERRKHDSLVLDRLRSALA